MSLSVRATRRLSLAARWRARLARALAPPVVVLLYHRVTPSPQRDPNRLIVRSGNFADHLAWLTGHARPLEPEEFAACLTSAGRWRLTPPSRPRVLLTFDDGYADNVHHALPVLLDHTVRATLFVASDLINGGQPFWWDALEQIVFDGHPPGGQWRLPDGSAVSADADRECAYRALHARLKPLQEGPRRAALADLSAQGQVTPRVVADARPATWEELRTWVAAGMMVGGHTCTHAALSTLNDGELRAEVMRCKHDLEWHAGTRVDGFSYPYGTDAEVDRRCEAAARAAGFRYAFVNRPGNARWARRPYALPRHQVGDWPAEEFARRFVEWCR